MKARTLLTLALSAAALAAVTVWVLKPVRLEVETGLVTTGPFLQTVDEDGVLRVRDRYRLTAPVAGLLQRPTLKVGDAVKRGQTLAVIEPGNAQLLDARTRTELVARREAAAARHDRAVILQRQAEESSRQAERDARRVEDLATRGFIPASDREKAALALAARHRELEAARFETDAALHDLQQARAAAGRDRNDGEAGNQGLWTLRAPVAGQVLSLASESGGPVGLGNAILELGDVAHLEAVIDVLSEDATRIAVGSRVSLVAGDTTTLTGQVDRIEPAARTKVSALGIEEQRVNVIVGIAGLDPATIPVGDGYRVEARIEITRRDAIVQVPVAALVRREGRWSVPVVENGRVVLKDVEIGLRNADTAEVLAGLQPGQRVVLYPGDSLRDGSAVRDMPQSR
ncbi:MAG: hypothetical protein RLZZ200_2117 [Pseudomonadota bacterium]|jgi:HlyD family secretion protein